MEQLPLRFPSKWYVSSKPFNYMRVNCTKSSAFYRHAILKTGGRFLLACSGDKSARFFKSILALCRMAKMINHQVINL